MAAKVRTIRITWENSVNFKMETKLGDEQYKTVVGLDEDGNLAALWEKGVEPICTSYFAEQMKIIGSEMKA